MTVLSNTLDAKDFFISKVLEQAARDNVVLSELEKDMLCYSHSGPGARRQDIDLVEQFADQHDGADFERRIADLLKNAYEHDVGQWRGARETYRRAFEELHKGRQYDYILIIIGRALRRKLKRRFFGIF